MNIYNYWDSVLKQDRVKIKEYFNSDAIIRWHDTNESFTVDEFIIANCEYPGEWNGEIERIENIDNMYITVTYVYTVDKSLSFHVVSFINTKDTKIVSIDEYWGEEGIAPKWRLDKNIGTRIK